MSEDEYRIAWTRSEKGWTCISCGANISNADVDYCPNCGGNPFTLDKHEVFTKEQLANQRAIRLGRKEVRSH